MGYEANFISKIDESKKAILEQKQAFEFVWRPQYEHFGNRKDILNSLIKGDGYCYPTGFSETMDQVETDMTLESFNGLLELIKFTNQIHKIYANHKTQHIAVPWGCDFGYENAKDLFRQYDTMIQYFNKNNKHNFTIMYSTPQRYLNEFKKVNPKVPVY